LGKEKEIVKDILMSYDEISQVREEDEKIFFSINNMEFVFGYIRIENKTDKPEIMIRNDEKYEVCSRKAGKNGGSTGSNDVGDGNDVCRGNCFCDSD